MSECRRPVVADHVLDAFGNGRAPGNAVVSLRDGEVSSSRARTGPGRSAHDGWGGEVEITERKEVCASLRGVFEW